MTTKTLKALKIVKKNDNDNVYEKLQLIINSAVIEVLFKWFYRQLRNF